MLVLLNILMVLCCFGVVTSKRTREIEVGFVKYLYLERANTFCTFLISQRNIGSSFCFKFKFWHLRIFLGTIRTCAYHRVRNVSFPETFVYVRNGSCLTSFKCVYARHRNGFLKKLCKYRIVIQSICLRSFERRRRLLIIVCVEIMWMVYLEIKF